MDAASKSEARERARDAVLARPLSLRRLREDSAATNADGKPCDDWTLAGSVVDFAIGAGWAFEQIAADPAPATMEAVRLIVGQTGEDGYGRP